MKPSLHVLRRRLTWRSIGTAAACFSLVPTAMLAVGWCQTDALTLYCLAIVCVCLPIVAALLCLPLASERWTCEHCGARLGEHSGWKPTTLYDRRSGHTIPIVTCNDGTSWVVLPRRGVPHSDWTSRIRIGG